MRDFLESAWYRGGIGGVLLAPLSWAFGVIVAVRGFLYRRGLLPSVRAIRPVVVVGNITVGGTGKTPLVLYLAHALAARGLRPGIVSRGYGARGDGARRVAPDAPAAEVGDEPALLARRAGVPVAVARRRAEAVALLSGETDLILCDDGLQHYALRRDLEIAVIDGARRLGNGRLLPAGPLREGRGRLDRVDFVVVNGDSAPEGWLSMRLRPTAVVRLSDGRREPLEAWKGRRVHAVAGIGHPERFFATLAGLGLTVVPHAYPDHARYAAGALDYADDLPVLMTEKDAVKYEALAGPRHWYVEVEAELPAADAERLIDAIIDLYSAKPRRLPTLE